MAVKTGNSGLCRKTCRPDTNFVEKWYPDSNFFCIDRQGGILAGKMAVNRLKGYLGGQFFY